MPTGKEMCEFISKKLKGSGINMTPEEICNLSPSGELWPVFVLYRSLKD